jgi:DNA-binding transcriptional MerR regulator
MIMQHGIGEAARRSGCTVQTIRYYERIGLVAPATRTSGNQRVYDDGAVDRLSFIRHARALGFKLDAVRELLELSANAKRTCEEIDVIAKTHLDAVRERIARLRTLETELARMVDACEHQTVAECRVVQVLSNHALCETDHPVVA